MLKVSLKKSLKKGLKKHPGGSGKLLSKQKSKDKLKEELSKVAKAMKAEEPAELVGALAPEEAPAPEEAKSLKGVLLRVISDSTWRYGAQGHCIAHDLVSGQVSINGGPGLGHIQVLAQHCTPAETFRKPQPYKHLNALSRPTKQELLSCSGLSLTAEDHSVEELHVVTEGTTELEDHQLHLGLLFLRWAWYEPLQGFRFVDPLLSRRFLLSLEDDSAEVTLRHQQALLSRKVGAKKLLLPVYAEPGHWTLLSLDLRDDGSVNAIRYRDSLSVQHSGCAAAAQKLLKVLMTEGQLMHLPERCNLSYQPAGSNLCGWYVLSWAEDEAAEFSGEGLGSRGLPQTRVKGLRSRLSTLTKLLQAEQKKQEAEKAGKEKEFLKKLEVAKKKAEALAAKESAKQEAAKAALEAAKLLAEGSGFTLSDLSKEAQEAILRVQSTGLGICPRCRWSSGCLSCDPEKAQRYWLEKESKQWLLKKLTEL